MGSSPSSTPVYLPNTNQQRVKILVAGPFGIGKTTMIQTLSEIPSLHTEEVMTDAAADIDELSVTDKKTTTVAIDFGRLTISQGRIVLYLFGTPGQRRFKPLWSDYARGALGALVIVDTRRLADSFEVMDLIEESGLDYAVAVNQFPDSPAYDAETLRLKLDIEDHTPLVICDARDWDSSLNALRALAAHLVSRSGGSR
ncbi:ATP/GTP-binding protein [Streptomyces cellulosae]|jgi:signal recognition particle receptor subunit beta|uniref:ATP/GTP-binding protein n=2 Tax=Streptomyces TaxID=1883 RepID=A0ABW6JHE8_STRCE|nr:ATP-binding protein [Streptomyces sp. McG7]MBT2902619.1 ATP-binding protein [Streptomyces sp. McG8]MCP8706942.1 ATP/GTP-binding protein [Streptomyces sp. AC04842]MCX4480363.1 ATP/GTP-binding protein [Streptomyces cellulosae]MDN3284889.1 ATP/GTP-binding protein [Streptomyces thermocarboxydus]MDQ0491415.1 signal recognition particle receptor subunit beta [Streptomyces thermodiastaticus]MYQ35043.1 ATP-binding protein [Streptomyces sp. SID4956]MYW51368.1 ATP-binding protein [Streptomyces sp. 